MNEHVKLDLAGAIEWLADRVASKLAASPISGRMGATKRLYTIAQAAEYIARSKVSVQHLVKSGALPTVRCDRRVFLDVRDLDRWIEEHKQA